MHVLLATTTSTSNIEVNLRRSRVLPPPITTAITTTSQKRKLSRMIAATATNNYDRKNCWRNFRSRRIFPSLLDSFSFVVILLLLLLVQFFPGSWFLSSMTIVSEVTAFVPTPSCYHHHQHQQFFQYQLRSRHYRSSSSLQIQQQFLTTRIDFLTSVTTITASASTSTTLYFDWLKTRGRNTNDEEDPAEDDRRVPISKYVRVETVPELRQKYTLAETHEDYLELRNGQRLVCIGDVHGDLWALQDFLEAARVYDRSTDAWIGGDTIIVQCGDVLDRGMEELACYELLAKLSHQALQHDGKVILLVGNHEALNALGAFQYAMNDHEHEKRIGRVVDDVLDTPNWRIQYGGGSSSNHQNNMIQPARWAAYEPGGLLSSSLMAQMKIAVRVGRTVCVHAGLRPSHLKDYGGIEGMNRSYKEWITLGAIIHDDENESENETNTSSNTNNNNSYSNNPVRYNHLGKYTDRNQINIDAQKRQQYYMESIPKFLKGAFGGPVWMREYSSPHDQQPMDPNNNRNSNSNSNSNINDGNNNNNNSIQQLIDETLLLLDADRMVMGHTIQRRINSALNEKAWRIDIGASRGCLGGTPEVLEVIHNNNVATGDTAGTATDIVSILTLNKQSIPAIERSVDFVATTSTTTSSPFYPTPANPVTSTESYQVKRREAFF